MSNILEQASLVLVPSGYKAGKVYSQIPFNGEGDLQFTRALDTATRVRPDGLIEGMLANVPRLDYTGGGCPKLLLEPQRTNVSLYSEQLDNAFWTLTNSETITANSTISPDGFQNADTLNAGAASSQVQGAIVGTSGAVYTVSIYVKRITGTGNVFLRAVENADTPISVTAEWQRFTATVTSTTTTIRIGIKLATSGDAVAIYGGQIEQGAYPTSYIPTLGAAVTRSADAMIVDDIFTNDLVTASGGTWYIEIDNNLVYTRDGSQVGIFIANDTIGGITTDGLALRNNGGVARLIVNKRISGVQTAIYTTSTDHVKVAFKWNGTTLDVFENGVKVVNATAFTPTIMEYFGSFGGDVPKYIIQSLLFPTPLTDTECIELTTL